MGAEAHLSAEQYTDKVHMTPKDRHVKDGAADLLATRVIELMRADDRIRAIARDAGLDRATRAAAALEAIADRGRIAEAVLEAIALENSTMQSRTPAVPAAGAPTLVTDLSQRDRALVTLAKRVETQSAEYNRLARRFEAEGACPRPAPVSESGPSDLTVLGAHFSLPSPEHNSGGDSRRPQW